MSRHHTLRTDLFHLEERDTFRLVSRLDGHRPYRVGELFEEGITRWEPEVFYDLDRSGHTLTLFCPSPSEHRVRSVASGRCEFALTEIEPLIVVLVKFGDTEWENAPYAWPVRNLGRPIQIVPPQRTGSGSALLWVTLVDADTGLIAAQRGVPLDPDFADLLHTRIRAQVRRKFIPLEYMEAAQSLPSEPLELAALAQRALVRAWTE